MSQDPFETDLREMIARNQMVTVVGSGVSIATNSHAPTWRALIESGVERCRAIGAPDDWCHLVLGQLKDPSYGDMLLSAAELVHEKLKVNGGSELARWLEDTFKEIQPEEPAVITVLHELQTPLVTTNYDDLIEKVTSLKHVSWTNRRVVSDVVRGNDRRVLHLHDHWEEPESVVLGIRSYEAVKTSEHTQAVMRAFGATKSFLFVGCGEDGLTDPNWGSFLTWLQAIEAQAGVKHRHYRLVRSQDKFNPIGRLYPLVYGEHHDDLAPFLKGLCSTSEKPDTAKPAITASPRASPAIGYYLGRLAQETSHLTLLGMGRSLQVELPIDEAYVPLRTTMARSLEQRKTERYKEGHAEYEENVDLGEVFRKVGQLKQRGVVLLGEPGSGKTTGAQQLAWRLASGQSLPEDLGLPSGITPVFLRFRNLSTAALAKRNGLRALLDEETHCDEAPDDLQSPGQELWNGAGGGLLWILDGLDEVIDSQVRKKVAGWVRNALKNRPPDWFLVTCRFQGYFRPGVPLGQKFVEFHVCPLDEMQIKRFVGDWFSAAYRKLLGPTEHADTRARADAGDLLDILARSAFQTGHIRELCTNPLLLTILCIVFHEERKLPTGRAELYAHCVRVLLEYWRRDLYDSELGTDLAAYDAEAAQAMLARIAWWMHREQDRTSAPLDDLAEEAAKGLAEVAESSGLGRDGRAFLERMRDETGILAMEGDGSCGFLHLSFQEYLAAEHAAREGLAKELASTAAESWWREAALLSLRRSRPFCEAFFREMLNVGIAENHPDLAERCLAEALYFTPSPFVEVLQQPPPKKKPARHRHDTRVAAILRLLRERAGHVPELEGICQDLAESTNPETRGFAREILGRVGIAPETPRDTEQATDTIVFREAADAIVVDRQTGMTFVTIRDGEFMMGSEKIDDWEKPVHHIKITRGFQLGKYPVTNAQYARFLEAKDSSAVKPEFWDDRKFNQPEQLVVGVSWKDALAYCAWCGCRLPTEAEWEYACRAGTTTEYSFGDGESELGEYAWYGQNSGGQTQPVGAKKPNPWGLHDMHGNVWEWCHDWAEKDYYKQSPSTNPKGPRTGSNRVFRGGSWNNTPRNCRAAFRGNNTPSSRDYDLGFRVARSSGASQEAEPGT